MRTPLLIASVLSVALAGLPAVAAPATAAPAAAPGTQPYASYWFPNTLLSWDPATDPDAPYNRSQVPLRPRVADPALKANANARAGEGKVSSLVSFAPTSNNPSQGASSPNYYAFSHWQYVDNLVFWGGSASEGIILAPNPTVIDAAHRNGVKVYGNIFFPPTAYGGQLQWVRDTVQKSGSTFPVADKLVQAARHYGFDGWFVNQETGGGDSALATSVRDFMKYLRAKDPGLDVYWYDAMTEGGSVSWQNALTSSNDAFFQDGATRVSDKMFLNFWWSGSGLSSSANLAASLGRSRYDLYSGIDTEANGYNSSVDWAGIYPSGQPHTTSLGIYRPEWTYNSSTSRADYYAKDTRYWVGANGDPSNTSTSSAWKGLANYHAEATPITSLPFVTSFNTGQGDRYAVDGTIVSTTGWHNLSLQDVLPTYRWVVSSTGTKLTPSLDFADAYNGGTSLLLSGKLDAANTIRLYQTKLPVSASTRLALTVKTPAAGATNLKAAVAFTDNPTSFTTIDVGSTAGTGWETKTLDLSAHAGKTIAQLGLRAEGSVTNYSIRVGQLAVHDAAAAASAPSGATVAGSADIVAGQSKSLRVTWTAAAGSPHHYNLYRRNANGSRTYLGGTTNTAYFVPTLTREGAETSTTIDVEAVSATFARSAPATTTVTWSGGGGTPTNLALNKSATGSSACASTETPAKAVNGSVSGGNADKWCSLVSSRWMQVDLGSARSITSFTVRHAGAGGESTAWNTKAFSIQLSTDGVTWSTPVTVGANTASVTTHPITATTARYAKLVVTTPTQNSDPAARIYEFEVYGV